MYLVTLDSMNCLGAAPTRPSTGFPSLKIRRAGMLCIWKALETTGFSSTFSFPKVTFPAYCWASCSMMGEIILQGPHQAAQKSTTMRGVLETVSSKVWSVRVMGLPFASD